MGQGGFGSPNDRLGIGLIGSECGALYSTVNSLDLLECAVLQSFENRTGVLFRTVILFSF